MDRGFLYLAKGQEFRREAKRSAKQISSVMPDYPIAVVTDSEVNVEYFDTVVIDSSEYTLGDKPRALRMSPYTDTVFLDTDIFIEKDISELFELLDQFELAVKRNRDQAHVYDNSVKKVPEAFPEFNTGVIGYRKNETVLRFIKNWARRCLPEHEFDQRSFRRALFDSSVRFTPLPNRYNCMYRNKNVVDGSVKVFHGPLVDRTKDLVALDEAVDKLNRSTEFRVHRRFQDTLFVDPPLPLITRVRAMYRNRGAAYTASKILEGVRGLLE